MNMKTKIWKDTAERYKEIYTAIMELKRGVQNYPSGRIRRCMCCITYKTDGCKGCPIREEWGMCGHPESKWTRLDAIVRQAKDQCKKMIESAEHHANQPSK